MEEVKEVYEKDACAHSCVNMHRFCSKKCCIVRCLIIVFVLLGTFALGCAFGTHRSYRSDWRDDYRYGRSMMMHFDDQTFRGSGNMMYVGDGFGGNVRTGSVQVGTRMMGQPMMQIQAVPATRAQLLTAPETVTSVKTPDSTVQ